MEIDFGKVIAFSTVDELDSALANYGFSPDTILLSFYFVKGGKSLVDDSDSFEEYQIIPSVEYAPDAFTEFDDPSPLEEILDELHQVGSESFQAMLYVHFQKTYEALKEYHRHGLDGRYKIDFFVYTGTITIPAVNVTGDEIICFSVTEEERLELEAFLQKNPLSLKRILN